MCFKNIALMVLFSLGVLWVIGFFWFISKINEPLDDAKTKTDAIIALTGGRERVATGVDLLKKDMAEKLLISGVNQKVDLILLAQTVDELPENLADNITLGHVACNTWENALESVDWMNRNEFKSLRLVTASYHMPRSYSEFKHIMPDKTIIKHPVFPPNFKHKEWWKWPGTSALIISEYSKFLVISMRHLISFMLPYPNPSFNSDVVCTK